MSIDLSTSAAANKSPLQITVSILPQEYFVKRIGGDIVEITTLVQPGHSPATYAPSPQQMAAIANSKIYFRIGVPFENSLLQLHSSGGGQSAKPRDRVAARIEVLGA